METSSLSLYFWPLPLPRPHHFYPRRHLSIERPYILNHAHKTNHTHYTSCALQVSIIYWSETRVLYLLLGGSHFCHMSVSPVSTTNPISSLYTDSILRLMPISVIMNRDILFHHLLFKETVICTGVVSSGKVLYEGFKNLCASLSSNSQSLVR